MPADELHSVGPETPPAEFTRRGATMIVEEQSSGPDTFVLLHGLGMGRTVFGDLVPLLAAHARVLAVDLPGYGQAPEPKRTLSMPECAEMVAALLRERGGAPAWVIGHSMGSQIAVELAARHPALVRGVILLAPTVDANARTWFAQSARLARDLWGESPKVIATGAREYARSWPHFFRELRAVLRHEPERVYPRVSCPALVMRGEHDRVSPREWCDTVVALLPDATYAEVPERGHETMIRDATAVAERVTTFCAEHTDTPPRS